MTQDEIISMARESGLHKMIQVKHVVDKVYEIPSEKLERFAALVAAHEREACAKVCDEKGKYFLDMLTGMIPIKPDVLTGALMCAAAIRAKGEK